MAVYFTSDTHFGHGNIIKYSKRPFLCKSDQRTLQQEGVWCEGQWTGTTHMRLSRDSSDIMNDYLTDRINEIVGVNDTLWHLGDWAFAPQNSYYHRCRFYRDRIKCQNVNIVWGNHDQPDKIRDLFNEAHFLHEIRVEGQQIVLCHYAMAVWNKSHRYAWQLYGHSHASAEPWMDRAMKGRRSFDVGVDNAVKLSGDYRPFSFNEVRDIMLKKDGFSMDHH